MHVQLVDKNQSFLPVDLSINCIPHQTTLFLSGVHYVFDTTFARNFSLIESCHEFIRRFKASETDKTALPMLTSACPGNLPTTLKIASPMLYFVWFKMLLSIVDQKQIRFLLHKLKL